MVTSRCQGLGQKALLCFVLMSAIFFVLPILLQADDSPEITKEEQLAEIAKNVAAKEPIINIIKKAINSGMNVDDAIESIIKAGVDASAVIYVAISHGYSPQLVVAGATKAGTATLPVIVKTAIVAGADPKTAAQGAVIAGAEPDAVATAVSTAALSPAPVFGYTPAALTPVVEVYAPPRIISLTGGGGATPSTKIASESKP